MLGFNYVLVIQKKWQQILNGINEKEFQTCFHPEYVKSLSLGAIWNFSKGTGLR